MAISSTAPWQLKVSSSSSDSDVKSLGAHDRDVSFEVGSFLLTLLQSALPKTITLSESPTSCCSRCSVSLSCSRFRFSSRSCSNCRRIFLTLLSSATNCCLVSCVSFWKQCVSTSVHTNRITILRCPSTMWWACKSCGNPTWQSSCRAASATVTLWIFCKREIAGIRSCDSRGYLSVSFTCGELRGSNQSFSTSREILTPSLKSIAKFSIGNTISSRRSCLWKTCKLARASCLMISPCRLKNSLHIVTTTWAEDLTGVFKLFPSWLVWNRFPRLFWYRPAARSKKKTSTKIRLSTRGRSSAWNFSPNWPEGTRLPPPWLYFVSSFSSLKICDRIKAFSCFCDGSVSPWAGVIVSDMTTSNARVSQAGRYDKNRSKSFSLTSILAYKSRSSRSVTLPLEISLRIFRRKSFHCSLFWNQWCACSITQS